MIPARSSPFPPARPSYPRLLRWLAVLACAATAAVFGACITNGHPLGTSGTVDIRVDIATPLFATNTVGMTCVSPDAGSGDAGTGGGTGTDAGTSKLPNGVACITSDECATNNCTTAPRQEPFSTGITLSLTEDGQPAWRAYVDVRVNPPEALALTSDPTEKSPSCVQGAGGFRCTATAQGYARLIASSQSQWSGMASVLVSWGGNAPMAQPITVSPAGLPLDATGFALLVSGLEGTAHVLATNTALQCTTGALPGSLGTAWRPGMIRSRLAYVTASPSPTEPGALANAPVVVESMNAEAALSLTADCAVRQPQLEVLLDPTGQSPSFYLCFSDNGGTISFAVTSGAKALNMQPQVIVDPEPRLLRVRSIVGQVPVSTAPVDLFEVSAFNADLLRIAIPVDVTASDNTVLQLDMASVTLADAASAATLIHAIPLMAGMSALTVSPSLFAMPACTSSPVTVVPATGATVVNGCDPTTTTLSAGNVTINFPVDMTPQQYSPACVHVNVGAMVTFTGNFTSFPLAPGPSVVANNPIVLTSGGTTVTFTFPIAGSYGFYSTADPTTMLGAVFVTP